MHEAKQPANESTFNEPTAQSSDDAELNQSRELWLTILHHPDSARVGEQVALSGLHGGLPVAISRSKPTFSSVTGERRALAHTRLSRTPIWLRVQNGILSISTPRSDLRVSVQGQPLRGQRDIDLRIVAERGVLIALGGCALLLLHAHRLDRQALAEHGMYGASVAVGRVHETIERVAPLSTPVLIRGESGVGKELVARALHQLSPRRKRPWVAVNLTAVPVATAASALFGHVRGAFTGANRGSAGYFSKADGGSLFLDEIGETASDIQPQLLRALENHEIQPVGGSARTVDVRVIAATDADLDALVATGQFRGSLLHRLQATLINVLPLRERPADIPVLLHHYLGTYLREYGALELLSPGSSNSGERTWLRLSVVTRLMRYRFPGNVRELRNIAARMALEGHKRSHASIPDDIKEAIDTEQATRPAGKPPRTARSGQPSGDIPADTIVATLREHQFNVTRSALTLGISKNTLTARIRDIPGLRLAGELTREEIADAMERVGTDATEVADDLQVSLHGLRLRMRELGLR